MNLVDWEALAHDLAGTVVRPDDAAYALARLPYNSRFDIHPQAVVFAQQVADVQHTLAFAQRNGLPLAARGGGHCYGGWSTSPGITLDMTRMKSVTTEGSAATGTATLGAGALLIDLYDALLAQGRCIPGGSCPTTGIAGLTQGGGIGSVSRAYGLTCDRLVAATVVTADGRVRECSADREPELFWALRGGGGGNFGVVTEFTFRTHPTTDVTHAVLRWDWVDAARVLDAWQHWAPSQPDEIWSSLHLTAAAKDGCSVYAELFILGNRIDAADKLAAAVGKQPVGQDNHIVSYRDMILLMAGCKDPVSQCHLSGQTPDGTIVRPSFVAASNFFPDGLPTAGTDTLIANVTRRAAEGGYGNVLLDSLGGAVGQVAPYATAFAHRRALFSAQYYNKLAPHASPSQLDDADRWQQGLRRTMRPWTGDSAYLNYADPHLEDFGHAYYGANLPRLVAVKAAYDPDRFFRFPQAVGI